MAMNKQTKILIAIGSLIILAGILVGVIVKVVMDTKNHRIPQKCPDEVKKCNGTNELYHVGSGRCAQKVKSDGLCEDNMVISPATTCAGQGVCECDYENNDRHLLYHNETKRCYFIYSQGPCDARKVVRPSKKVLRFRCKSDVCADKKLQVPTKDKDSIVPYEGSCYSLGTKVHETGCKEGLKFWKNQEAPSCSPPPTLKAGCISCYEPPAPPCPFGSKGDFRGFCKPTIDFIMSPGDDDED